MIENAFRTDTGTSVPAVTADEMRAVDRIAVEEVGLGLLQMMENAGRNLARHVLERSSASVAVVAGDGGNGGGGLACARHLSNRGVAVEVVLDRPGDDLSGAAATQYQVLDAAGVPVSEAELPGSDPDVVVDALVGYGIEGPLRGTAETLVEGINEHAGTVVSLDVPSGIDATSGEERGAAVAADSTVTLALPKTGLVDGDAPVVLGDIAVPSVVYERAGLGHDSPFEDAYLAELERVE